MNPRHNNTASQKNIQNRIATAFVLALAVIFVIAQKHYVSDQTDKAAISLEEERAATDLASSQK